MLNIAHRGASGYAPENTRAAFERAIEMGADMIETDVRLTFDNELVLVHDATVTRTTNGAGPVADHTIAELKGLDAGSWFSSAFAGERVVTLHEVIDEFASRIPIVLEIKDAGATARTVEAVIGASFEERVHITSFIWSAVLEAKAIAPNLTIGFLTPEFDRDIIQRCARRGFAQVCPRVDTLTPGLVREAKDAGLIVRAWGISRRDQIGTLFDTGVDGATVNWPDWIPAHER